MKAQEVVDFNKTLLSRQVYLIFKLSHNSNSIFNEKKFISINHFRKSRYKTSLHEKSKLID